MFVIEQALRLLMVAGRAYARPALALNSSSKGLFLLLAAEEMQEQHEQIDEAQIEGQGAHHGEFGHALTAGALIIEFLDALGVIGGKSGEDQNTDDPCSRERC